MILQSFRTQPSSVILTNYLSNKFQTIKWTNNSQLAIQFVLAKKTQPLAMRKSILNISKLYNNKPFSEPEFKQLNNNASIDEANAWLFYRLVIQFVVAKKLKPLSCVNQVRIYLSSILVKTHYWLATQTIVNFLFYF